jgi:hypothetical protein
MKPPWAPYQGSTLDQLGTLSGPQTPRLLTPPPNHKSWIRPWSFVSLPHIRYLWILYVDFAEVVSGCSCYCTSEFTQYHIVDVPYLVTLCHYVM